VDERGDGGRGSAHSGRLELTWTNKDKRLLSYEDGSYVWVTPSDHRVAEVRLLDDAGTVGAVNAERGRRGRSRLAVIDGLVNADVAQVLVDALPEDEVLTLCGTAVDEATGPALRALRRGSTVRKIPASILADYRRPRGAASDKRQPTGRLTSPS